MESIRFFYGTLFLFFVSAGWIALSGKYSMAFDESTHLGIIRIYATRLLPFWSQAPQNSHMFGAIARDPSYLYHYLLSFLYRFIALFVHSQTKQVILLRFINIAMFGLGLAVFRQVLLNAKMPKRVVHVVLGLFVLTPVVPFLAAQINYDNMLFLVAACTVVQAQLLLNELDRKKLNVNRLVILVSLCLLGSLVKYAFLPISMAIAGFVGYKLIQRQRTAPKRLRLTTELRTFISRSSRLKLFGVAALLIISFGLFGERYGYNLYRYKTPNPECNQVLSINDCKVYEPWERNYRLRIAKEQGDAPVMAKDPLHYGAYWAKWISNQLFYTLNVSSGFVTGQPLTVTRFVSVTVVCLGVVLSLFKQRELRKKYMLDMLLVCTIFYIAILFLQNYTDFLHLGSPVAIQGRYLVPVLIIFYSILGLSYFEFLRASSLTQALLVVTATTFLLTQGGGAGIYILRSDQSWYWQNRTVIRANNLARDVLHNVAIGE